MAKDDETTVTTTFKNGVRVTVRRWKSGGTTVDATCQCFGMSFRCHSNPSCPNLRKQEKS